MARRGGEPERFKSVGERVTDSEEVKSLLSSKRGKVNIEVKAIISALTTDANGSAGDLLVPMRAPLVDQAVERRMTVRDLFTPVGPTSRRSSIRRRPGSPTRPPPFRKRRARRSRSRRSSSTL
jgi:hypothetical protein